MSKRNTVRILAALVALTASAYAGAKYNYNVYVGTTMSYGTMGTARASVDNYQFLGCYKYGTNTYSSVTCTARDATGKQMACFSRNADLKDAASGITDGAYISFHLDPADTAKCDSLLVDAASAYAPPQL
jgi:hypothetical protein